MLKLCRPAQAHGGPAWKLFHDPRAPEDDARRAETIGILPDFVIPFFVQAVRTKEVAGHLCKSLHGKLKYII